MNPMASAHKDENKNTRPSLWLALAALVLAPLGGTIVDEVVFRIGTQLAGFEPESLSLRGLALEYFAFAIVLIPLGGLLLLLFWKWAPFGFLLSSAFGAVCGALLGYISFVILPHEETHALPGVVATVGLGLVGGLAGGATIWLIFLLGSGKRNG